MDDKRSSIGCTRWVFRSRPPTFGRGTPLSVPSSTGASGFITTELTVAVFVKFTECDRSVIQFLGRQFPIVISVECREYSIFTTVLPTDATLSLSAITLWDAVLILRDL